MSAITYIASIGILLDSLDLSSMSFFGPDVRGMTLVEGFVANRHFFYWYFIGLSQPRVDVFFLPSCERRDTR